MSSDTYSPEFDYRHEIRGTNFDSTLCIYMTLFTKDKSNNENALIGISTLNLFINRFTKKHCENTVDNDKLL